MKSNISLSVAVAVLTFVSLTIGKVYGDSIINASAASDKARTEQVQALQAEVAKLQQSVREVGRLVETREPAKPAKTAKRDLPMEMP